LIANYFSHICKSPKVFTPFAREMIPAKVPMCMSWIDRGRTIGNAVSYFLSYSLSVDF